MISNHISHTVSSKTISGQFWRYIMQLPVTVTHRFIICLMSLSGMKTIGLPTNDDWVNRALNINGKLFFFKSNRKYWRTDIVGGSWVWVGGWFVFFLFWGGFCDTLSLVGWNIFLLETQYRRQLLTTRIACTWAYCLPF